MKIHAGMIEVAVASFIDYRKHTIVPNISHGLFPGQECDLLALDSKNRFTEIEIKISISDLKTDFLKNKHSYPNKYISRLVYAIPENLITKAKELIPERYGIIAVRDYEVNGIVRLSCRWERIVKYRKDVTQLPDYMIKNFCRLGCMRIWSLKAHNNRKIFISKN